MIRKILLTCSILMSAAVYGQKIQYTGSLETGLVNGSHETSYSVNTTHGIRIGQWSASVGAGIDNYRFRSVPLFLDLKRYINVRKVQPYIQLGAGVNIAWPMNSEKVTQRWWSGWWPQSDTTAFSNGFHSRAIAGVVLNPKKAVRVSVFAGWSFKSIETSTNENVYNGTGSIVVPRITKYDMNRLYFGLGIGF